MNTSQLEEALEALSELLEDQGLTFDLVVIGGGALLLSDLLERPTQDLDVVARFTDGRLGNAKPLPDELQACIQAVALALDLAREDRDGTDWLNPGPAFLLQMGLPTGFASRLVAKRFGTSLTLRLPARQDHVALKLWSATLWSRGAAKKIDVADLAALNPTREELIEAARWCDAMDGSYGFLEAEIIPVLVELGHDIGSDDV